MKKSISRQPARRPHKVFIVYHLAFPAVHPAGHIVMNSVKRLIKQVDIKITNNQTQMSCTLAILESNVFVIIHVQKPASETSANIGTRYVATPY